LPRAVYRALGKEAKREIKKYEKKPDFF
jgi:hypothetical protein